MGAPGRIGAVAVSRSPSLLQTAARVTLCLACVVSVLQKASAQNDSVERTFPESKSTIEKALKELQPSMSGHLPALEGFVETGELPLSRYQRPFYQCAVRVTASAAGGSVVRLSARVTAWYADANSSHSGYRLLASNGRIENDLLDRLSQQLSSKAPSADHEETAAISPPAQQPGPNDEPAPAAPAPQFAGVPSQSVNQHWSALATARQPSDADAGPSASEPKLPPGNSRDESATLEEVLKNQAHPKNLVAVKKSGTPVVASASLDAKTLFLATAHDEFEMLDFTGDWVHVRISGLSRGWIWRTSLEMPDGISDIPPTAAYKPTTAADLFQVSREETAPFPGDWVALRGKNVKIISVQKIQENELVGGAAAKLAFAKTLLDKSYAELVKSPDLAGVVLIFDSADGGMIAATLATIRQWKAGTLNDAAMWHHCYFDPPETFAVSSSSASP